MSTWTSSPARRAARQGPVRARGRLRAALLAGCTAVLAACFETQALGQLVTRVSGTGPGAVGVLGGAVTVAAPEGWCIDQTAMRESADQVFVLFRRCRTSAAAGSVLSVTVTNLRIPEGDRAAQLAGLAGFLDTEVGRGQLSRRGWAADVAILSIAARDGALWMQLSDAGNPAAFDPVYHRVVMPLAGRLVTLAALAPRGAPADPAAAEAELAELAAVLRQRNLD